MKTLEKNNRLPAVYSYEVLSEHLIAAHLEFGEDVIGVGNNTTARWDDEDVTQPDEFCILITLHDTVVCRMYRSVVQLNSGGYKSKTTKDRMDRALKPLGLRMTTIYKNWYVYNVTTGAYVEYFDGMVVSKETGGWQ